MRPLGRVTPPDWEHVDKYPLTAPIKAEITTPRPVVIGINWYDAFDEPVKRSDGYYWMKELTSRSNIRGGHAVCLKPRRVYDRTSWYHWYNQQNEGICVSEAVSHMQSLNNRRMFQPRWVYDRCKERDGIPDEEGTYVRTGLKVLKDLGMVTPFWGEDHILEPHALDYRKPKLEHGISAYRWARSIDDVLEVLGYGDLDFVDVLNSWGEDYPHYTRMSADTLERLWMEDGEIGIATDR